METVFKTSCRLAASWRRVNMVPRFACAVLHPTCHQRKYSTDVMPPPQAEGLDKIYAPKIKKIVDDISQLTLIEVADLNELLKKTLNIADAPVMAMGAMGVGQPAKQDEDDVEVKQEKTIFTVKLLKFEEAKKVALIKEIKSLIAGMNLVQAKKFVESAPQIIKQDVPKEEANQLKEALEKIGASVEIE